MVSGAFLSAHKCLPSTEFLAPVTFSQKKRGSSTPAGKGYQPARLAANRWSIPSSCVNNFWRHTISHNGLVTVCYVVAAMRSAALGS